MGIEGRIHSVETFGTVDGPGIRYVVFLQGCALRCKFCHNPDSWHATCGKSTNSEHVVAGIERYRSFLQRGGVTVSGGEPLLQPEFTLDIIKRVKDIGLHTALDTAGSVPLERSKRVLDAVDLVLLDIKSIDDKVCWSLTGRGNSETLATLDYLEQIGKRVWIRQVVVPGWTSDTHQMELLADHLASYRCVELVELLPFHKMGEYKWQQLGYQYSLSGTREPSSTEMQEIVQIMESRSLKVLMQGKEDRKTG